MCRRWLGTRHLADLGQRASMIADDRRRPPCQWRVAASRVAMAVFPPAGRSDAFKNRCNALAAEREGVRSLFVEEGEAIRQMLQQLEAAERQPALQGFIRSLLSIWPGHSVRKAAEGLEEELTEREREVVCLAAKGMSNDEIGKQLSLALGTVKWHLHNIYEKLKVRNRTQAIRRVRELSLLEP